MSPFSRKNRPNKKRPPRVVFFLCFEGLNQVVVRLVQTLDSLKAVCRDLLSTAICSMEKIADNNTFLVHLERGFSPDS